MESLLLVGAVPPPYHGQAVVTEMVFRADYGDADVECLNLPFSEDMDSVGGVKLKKLLVLWRGIIGMLSYWWRHRGEETILYYCAGSANWVPLVKDVVLLGVMGRFFSQQVVHYHSGGLPAWFAQSKLAAVLGKVAYGRVTKAVALTKAVEVPCYTGTELCIVPNGLDVNAEVKGASMALEGLTFLYVGSLRETKGIGVIIEAARALASSHAGQDWQVNLVGDWASVEEREKWTGFVESEGLSERINFLGRLTGDAKWAAFAQADVFLFPSFYESENQPLVVIEAMAMGLPIIASRWRGIPELLEEGLNGVLVAPEDAFELVSEMQGFLSAPEKCAEMSRQATASYLATYTERAFVERLQAVLGL